MAQIQLPKLLYPGFGKAQIPSGPDVELDRSNAFGARTHWAFFPSTANRIEFGGPALTHYVTKTLGQPMMAEMIRDTSSSSAPARIGPINSNSWGYRGLCADLYDQTSSGGREFRFGEGSEGQIKFPNPQSVTIWGLIIPDGNGSGDSGSEDPRVLSRDNGSATNSHYYMIGGVRNGGNVRTRGRWKFGGGATTTLVVTSQNWQDDSLNFIAGSYDGSTFTMHHIREDGGYGSNTSSETGDLSDSSASGVGLAVGGNYVQDNAFQGQIIACGALDYCEDDEFKLRLLARDVGQILRPKTPRQYFIPDVVGPTYTLTANSGTFNLTGTSADLDKSSLLTANSGTFNLTGASVDLDYTVVLTANSGAYSLTGTNADLDKTSSLTANSGTFNLTGTNADLDKSSLLTANSGSYTLTGTDADLTFQPAGSFTLTANSGSFTLTGTSADLDKSSLLTANSGSYALTGTNADLNFQYTLVSNSGSFALTGTNTDLIKSSLLSASSGSYNLTGTSAGLTYSGQELWTVQSNSSASWTVQSNDGSTWTVQ